MIWKVHRLALGAACDTMYDVYPCAPRPVCAVGDRRIGHALAVCAYLGSTSGPGLFDASRDDTERTCFDLIPVALSGLCEQCRGIGVEAKKMATAQTYPLL